MTLLPFGVWRMHSNYKGQWQCIHICVVSNLNRLAIANEKALA